MRNFLATLTPRQLEIYNHRISGKTAAQSAKILGIVPRTVELHIMAITRKAADFDLYWCPQLCYLENDDE